jgi:hypothetical protein
MKTYKLSSQLSASLLGGMLMSASSAFAETDAERIKNLETKLDAMQTELSQMTLGMAHHSNNGAGLPLHGFADFGIVSNSDSNLATNPKGFFLAHCLFIYHLILATTLKHSLNPSLKLPRRER